MKFPTNFTLIGLFYLLTSTVMAAPVGISASASFLGGASGSWSFEYTAGAPDLYLQKITIDLSPTELHFDTWALGFGSLAHEDVGSFSGTETTTGLWETSATGVTLDGGGLLSFSFHNFLPGMGFQFRADVDRPDPTLLPLLDCSGLGRVARAICNATNATRTAANNVSLLAAEWVGPNAMAGATVSFQFGGPDYATRTVTGTFGSVTLRDVIERLSDGDGDDAFASEADAEAPEPATLAMFGAGLGAVVLLRRRRGSAE